MRYEFIFFQKIRKSAGNHGLLLMYDATRFQLIEIRGITFKNLFGIKINLHSQVATIYTLLDTDPLNKKRMSKED